MDELISVIVPVYNVEKYISRCIESIMKQTYKNIEIILIDDGSTDNSGKICDEYSLKDDRINVIHKKNGGLSDARNTGLDIAKGKYISLIDSDDFVSKFFIETLYNTCKNENCEIAICEYERVYEEKEEISDLENDNKVEIYNSKQMLQKIYSKDYLITTVAWNKLYKAEILKNIRYPVGKLHEDEAITYKILYGVNKVAIIRKKLYYYYYDINSIMNKKYNLKRLDILDALKERMIFFKEKNEIELFELSSKQYTLALINCYVLCRRNIENSEDLQKKLLKQFRDNSRDVIKYKNIKLKTKLVIIFASIFPKLYGKMFVK